MREMSNRSVNVIFEDERRHHQNPRNQMIREALDLYNTNKRIVRRRREIKHN